MSQLWLNLRAEGVSFGKMEEPTKAKKGTVYDVVCNPDKRKARHVGEKRAKVDAPA